MKTYTLFLILFSSLCACQNITAITETAKYEVNNKLYEFKNLTIYNKSKENMLIWLSKNEKENYKTYFNKKGDFSLIDWLTDENFSDYTIEIYTTFLKIVKPKESFLIIYKGTAPYVNQCSLSQLPVYIKNPILNAEKYDSYKIYQAKYLVLE